MEALVEVMWAVEVISTCIRDGHRIQSAEGQRYDPRLGHTDLLVGGCGYREVA